MKLQYEKFQTPPETGNKRFIFRPVVRNKNPQIKWKGKKICFLQEDFGFPRRATLPVNNSFKGTTFTSYEGFLERNDYMPSQPVVKKIFIGILFHKGKISNPINR